MSVEKRREIAKALALVVGTAGIVVIIGWIFDIGVLKSILPSWVSMKFDTALAFVFSGITLYFMVRIVEGEFDKAQVVLSVSSLVIFMVMGILLFSSFLRIYTGVEELVVKDIPVNEKTVVPGRPSAPTMVNFLLIAATGVLAILDQEKLRARARVMGLIIGAIGVLAVAGYILNMPLLYYFIEGVNTGMACNTAVLFVFIGAGFLCL